MWGWWDSTTWISHAGIYTLDKRPKKAAHAIQRLWQEEFNTSLAIQQPVPGWLEFEGFYGTYEYTFTTPSGDVQRGTLVLGRNQPWQSLVHESQYA